jgi:hypothetical protein
MNDDTRDALLHAWGWLKAHSTPELAEAMLAALDSAERQGYEVPAFLREM